MFTLFYFPFKQAQNSQRSQSQKECIQKVMNEEDNKPGDVGSNEGHF